MATISRQRGRHSKNSAPAFWCGAVRTRRWKAARERNVVLEFADRDTAMACYRSAEYQAARAIRQKYADADLTIIEGAS
jgi:uncharacterized protein (DUF1330 family)